MKLDTLGHTPRNPTASLAGSFQEPLFIAAPFASQPASPSSPPASSVIIASGAHASTETSSTAAESPTPHVRGSGDRVGITAYQREDLSSVRVGPSGTVSMP